MDQTTCQLCSQFCDSTDELREHLLFHFYCLQKDVNIVVGQLSGYTGKSFTQWINKTSKPFQCTLCPTAFDTKSSLLRHGASHLHTVNKCPICSQDFHGAFKFLYNHHCTNEQVQTIRNSLEMEIEKMMGQLTHQDTVRTYTRKRRRALRTGDSVNGSRGELHNVPTPPFDPLNTSQLRGEHSFSVQEESLPTQIRTESTTIPVVQMQSEYHGTEPVNDSQGVLLPTYPRLADATEGRFASESLTSLDPPFPALADIGSLSENSRLPQIPFEFSFKRAAAPSYVPLWNQLYTGHHGTMEGAQGGF
ncbi:hypothetical protein F4824DRAFT_297797 [Ustulina deusta]|nr:hypothetical protein F4824DRAFT_297797 [Ustulina deusta]